MGKPLNNDELFTKNFILTSLSTFTLFTSFYFLLITLPFYIQELGGSDSEIGYIIGMASNVAMALFTLKYNENKRDA
jgi:hypothetical protein